MHRHVRRLRFTCAHSSDAQQGRILFEDALRTASLGDESRFILVRRLELGRMPLHVSPTDWSKRLEQAFRATRVKPIRFDAPGARHAPAIYFPNRHEPWLAAVVRVATQRPFDEWFWRPALGGWNPAADDIPVALRHCFRRLAHAGGLALTLQLASRLHAHRALPLLLSALDATDLSDLEPTLNIEPASNPAPPDSSPPFSALSTTETACLARWGRRDLRTRWLAAVYLTRPLEPPQFPLAVSLDPTALDALVATAIRPSAPASSSASITPDSPPLPPAPAEPIPCATTAAEPAFTRAGGLFFVLPLLDRVGLPAHLATLPTSDATALPWQILRLLLVHARILESDTLPRALAGIPAPTAPLGRWLIAANRLALRLSPLNLRRLVVRPAVVSLTPTHIDVFFRPGDADVRLRRTGLDFDPGWLPWLGRTIAFHFDRAD